jgi:hypothetical protein
MRFAIVTVAPAGYAHAGAFAEISAAYHHALIELGHVSVQTVNTLVPGARHIVFGANLLGAADALPPDSIIVNLEQLAGNPYLPDAYRELLRRHTVWEYSATNMLTLVALGCPAPRHVPIGYVPQLSRIAALAPERQDIDVLFYGSLNARRNAVLEGIAARGLSVKTLFGVYGDERDAWIARSRIVLNMHFHDSRILEAVRISYLLANGVFVVSERGSDAAEAARFEGGVAFAAFDRLVETCALHAADNGARRRIAARGRELIQHQPQTAWLKRALDT